MKQGDWNLPLVLTGFFSSIALKRREKKQKNIFFFPLAMFYFVFNAPSIATFTQGVDFDDIQRYITE